MDDEILRSCRSVQHKLGGGTKSAPHSAGEAADDLAAKTASSAKSGKDNAQDHHAKQEVDYLFQVSHDEHCSNNRRDNSDQSAHNVYSRVSVPRAVTSSMDHKSKHVKHYRSIFQDLFRQ
jgi:hypothetical protein